MPYSQAITIPAVTIISLHWLWPFQMHGKPQRWCGRGYPGSQWGSPDPAPQRAGEAFPAAQQQRITVLLPTTQPRLLMFDKAHLLDNITTQQVVSNSLDNLNSLHGMLARCASPFPIQQYDHILDGWMGELEMWRVVCIWQIAGGRWVSENWVEPANFGTYNIKTKDFMIQVGGKSKCIVYKNT